MQSEQFGCVFYAWECGKRQQVRELLVGLTVCCLLQIGGPSDQHLLVLDKHQRPFSIAAQWRFHSESKHTEALPWYDGPPELLKMVHITTYGGPNDWFNVVHRICIRAFNWPACVARTKSMGWSNYHHHRLVNWSVICWYVDNHMLVGGPTQAGQLDSLMRVRWTTMN